MPNNRPWFPWYPADYKKDTLFLSDEADLLYRRLLEECWEQNGLLPKQLENIAKTVRFQLRKFKRVWPEVSHFFYETDEGFRNKRLDIEIKKLIDISEKRKEAVRKRKNRPVKSNDSSNATYPQQSIDSVPTPTPTLNLNTGKNQNSPPEKTPEKNQSIDSANAAVKSAKEAQENTIWKIGVEILIGQGETEKQARSFLGKLIKDSSQSLVAQKIAVLSTVPKADAKAWLRAACVKHKDKVFIPPASDEKALVDFGNKHQLPPRPGENTYEYRSRLERETQQQAQSQ